jgi:hypothetical protein
LHQERGNFLLQSLLALGFIFAFIPLLSQQLNERNIDTKMFSATRQVELAQTAARIFIRENINNLPYDTTIIAGNDFADTLEPYGLPLGFVPKTAMGQDIKLIIHKTNSVVSAYLQLTGGNLNGIQQAELVRRIGFYAAPNNDAIDIGIELQDIYSDVVRRNETNLENSGFLTDLDMGNFSITNAANLFAVHGDFETAEINTLSILGTESGRKAQNNIKQINTEKSVFQTKTGESALTLTKGTLYADSANVKSISAFGDTGNFTAFDVSINDLSMTAGRTSFTGPANWEVRGSVVTNNINFTVERLDISSHLITTRGQDVYVDEDTLTYNTKSGIETGVLYTSNITMRDQTSGALNSGQAGTVIIDIRPAGTSLLPDVLTSDVNNDAIKIIKNVKSDDDDLIDCKAIINDLDGTYNKQSLSQYLICQYVYWQRLEKRIDIKKCLMDGGNGCI